MWNDTTENPPRCAACRSLLRPDVVWFHENLPARPYFLPREAASNGDVFLSVGTSMLVYPAAALPLNALQGGARTNQINPEPTDLDALADFTLHGKAGEVLPALLDAVWGSRG